jgi:NitT/TauT family transport system ATP-binding protein
MSASLREISKSYGELSVLDGINLDLPQASVTAILGPSGCGKTTLLKIMIGLIAPDSGQIEGITPERAAFVFQEPRLLPWLSVLGNIRLVSPLSRRDARDSERLASILRLVDLWEFRDCRPRTLSGGMRQRVSLARAFAPEGMGLLLLDEPFQGIDLKLKISVMNSFVGLWKNEPKTVVLVTHDVQEALFLGQRILVLSERPSHVLSDLRVPGLPGERDLARPEFIQLEHKLLQTLIAG